MGNQDDRLRSLPQPPATNDLKAWRNYWQLLNEPWRIEPEIDVKRQAYLSARRIIVPNIQQGIYPFKGIHLSRADVEWLLATHENGYGPVYWEENQEHRGLDLRGADLSQENLHGLPLAYMRGGLAVIERLVSNEEQREWAGVQLEGANLDDAHLERAMLAGAYLKKASLRGAHLEGSDLSDVQMGSANLFKASLENAFLGKAHLENVSFNKASLERADLSRASLTNSDLSESHLEGVSLAGAHLEGANLYKAHLEGANLQRAFFDAGTFLREVALGNENFGYVEVAGTHWGDVDLSAVDWRQMHVLGDEQNAHLEKTKSGSPKRPSMRLDDYQAAVRANRQLAVALQNQGLNEEAGRFAYRAQKLQRVVWRRQRRFGQYLFSWFLFLLTGYGYKPTRSFIAYLLVITGFATAYYLLGRTIGPSLSPLGAFVFSMTSFHGRGFFPGGIQLDDPLTVLAALEAFVGLLIEVTFIATLTQRLFNK